MMAKKKNPIDFDKLEEVLFDGKYDIKKLNKILGTEFTSVAGLFIYHIVSFYDNEARLKKV